MVLHHFGQRRCTSPLRVTAATNGGFSFRDTPRIWEEPVQARLPYPAPTGYRRRRRIPARSVLRAPAFRASCNGSVYRLSARSIFSIPLVAARFHRESRSKNERGGAQKGLRVWLACPGLRVSCRGFRR